jgi:hypothetical protein
MPHDGYMILPNAHAHDGDEWGYFGTPYHTHYEIH